jgi:hemin uptake protein HemP
MNTIRKNTQSDSAAGQSASSGAAEAGVISSRELLGSHKRLNIEHNGEHYTLRITSNNKLILTK